MAAESKNNNLHQAKEAKNDEFYTQLSDIQAELSHYTDKFQGKVVFCNCDDPFESNFVKYFLMNFNRLGLKELIATGYKSSFIGGSEIGEPHTPYALRVKGTQKYLVGTQKDLDIRGAKCFLEAEKENIMTPLIGNKALDESGQPIQISVKEEMLDENGNPVLDKKGKSKTKVVKKDVYYEAGDFRSDMCLALLRETDICVTNPPFSLFREYLGQLLEYDKKFIILGNKNCITYKEVFPLLRDDKIWIGVTPMGRDLLFDFPTDCVEQLKTEGKEGSTYKIVSGVIKRRSPSIWVTNIDHAKRHQILPLDLGFVYNGHEDMYPKYDNYNAINVNKISEIPCDYEPCWYKCPHATNCQYALTKGKDENNALCEMVQPCENGDRQTNDCAENATELSEFLSLSIINIAQNSSELNENKYMQEPLYKKCNGVMGVPITFFDKYCPEQFEIIGADEAEGTGFSNGLFISESKHKQCYTNNKRIYKRIFIKRKQ